MGWLTETGANKDGPGAALTWIMNGVVWTSCNITRLRTLEWVCVYALATTDDGGVTSAMVECHLIGKQCMWVGWCTYLAAIWAASSRVDAMILHCTTFPAAHTSRLICRRAPPAPTRQLLYRGVVFAICDGRFGSTARTTVSYWCRDRETMAAPDCTCPAPLHILLRCRPEPGPCLVVDCTTRSCNKNSFSQGTNKHISGGHLFSRTNDDDYCRHTHTFPPSLSSFMQLQFLSPYRRHNRCEGNSQTTFLI